MYWVIGSPTEAELLAQLDDQLRARPAGRPATISTGSPGARRIEPERDERDEEQDRDGGQQATRGVAAMSAILVAAGCRVPARDGTGTRRPAGYSVTQMSLNSDPQYHSEPTSAPCTRCVRGQRPHGLADRDDRGVLGDQRLGLDQQPGPLCAVGELVLLLEQLVDLRGSSTTTRSRRRPRCSRIRSSGEGCPRDRGSRSPTCRR